MGLRHGIGFDDRFIQITPDAKSYVYSYVLPEGEGGGREAIGQRIIEVAEDVARTSLRDPRSGFIAYVPVGSIKRGELLVTTGGRGKTTQCGICHGQDLKGLGNVRPLAGRSPSYTVRQPELASVDGIADRLRFAPLMDINSAASCPLVRRLRLISVFVHRLARLIHRRQRRIRERNCCEKAIAKVLGGRKVLGKAVKKPNDLSKGPPAPSPLHNGR